MSEILISLRILGSNLLSGIVGILSWLGVIESFEPYCCELGSALQLWVSWLQQSVELYQEFGALLCNQREMMSCLRF